MEALIIIILTLSILQFSLQLSVFQINKIEFIYLLLIGIGIYLAYPYAIEQSYSLFQKTVANINIINNFIAIMIVETIVGLLMSIFMIRLIYKEPVKKFWSILNYIPGIIVFPAIFYAESYAFLNITSLDFMILATLLSLFIPALLWGIKKIIIMLIPETDVRFELKFFIHVIQLILGIILSIMIYKIPVMPSNITYDIKQLIIIILSSLVFFVSGIFIYRYKITKHQK